VEGTGTVTFDGTGDVSITPAETFYNLTLDKVSSADWLTPNGDLTIGNDLVINPGALYSGNNTYPLMVTRLSTVVEYYTCRQIVHLLLMMQAI